MITIYFNNFIIRKTKKETVAISPTLQRVRDSVSLILVGDSEDHS